MARIEYPARGGVAPANGGAANSVAVRPAEAFREAIITDAVSVVISEETGNVTVFHDRKMTSVGSAMELKDILMKLFTRGGKKRGSES